MQTVSQPFLLWSFDVNADLRSDASVALLVFFRSLMNIHGIGSGRCHSNPRSEVGWSQGWTDEVV